MYTKAQLLEIHAEAMEYHSRCAKLKEEMNISPQALILDAVIQFDTWNDSSPETVLFMAFVLSEAEASAKQEKKK